MIYLKNNTDPQEIFIPRETVDVSKAFNYYTKEQTDLKLAQNKSATLNEVGVMLTEYATEEYVQNEVKNVKVDLTGYATEEYVQNEVQNVKVDLTGYATEEYVKKEVENVQVDLTGYATEDYVNAAIKDIDVSQPVMIVDELGNFSGDYEKVLRMINNEETGYQILIKPYDGDTYIQHLGVMKLGDGQGRIMACFVNSMIDITWKGLDATKGNYSLEEVSLGIFTNDMGYVTGDELGNYATKDEVNAAIEQMNGVVGDINKILTTI